MSEQPASPTRSVLMSSPRSSTDLQPHSPSRFRAFHHRFRSNSSSGPIDLQPPPPPPPPLPPLETSAASSVDVSIRNEAVRSARRFLLATIRDDWTFPPSDDVGEDEPQLREPISYICREEGSSDLDIDDFASHRYSPTSSYKEINPYKFENPDAVAASIAERRRRRRKLSEDEMQWNEGLRAWSQQRDAWTAAVNHLPGKRKSQSMQDPTLGEGPNASDSMDVSTCLLQFPNSPTSQASETSSSTESVETADADLGPWLPVFPPLLPAENPVRANIKPAAYGLIYSKVVVQGLTPSVPIPLGHMVLALVEGWKAEGNWPPPSSVPVTATGNSGRRMSQLLRFRKAQAQNAEKGRVSKGIGAVKKALGVGGTPPPEEWVMKNGKVTGTGLGGIGGDGAQQSDDMGIDFEGQEGDGEAAGNAEGAENARLDRNELNESRVLV